MNTMNNILVSAGVSVLILVLGLSVFGGKSTVIKQTLGAQSVGVTDGNCYVLNGEHRCPTVKGLTTATTTVCAIQGPAATSTLQWAYIRFAVSTTSASTVTMAKAATAYATTTTIGGGALGANAQGTFTATTSPTTATSLDGPAVIAPNSWIVVGMAGNGANTYSPSGVCGASFVY